MTKYACLKCGKRRELQGTVEGIRTRVCCSQCCEKFKVPFEKRYVGTARYPERLARKYYGCSKKDLSELDYCEILYPGRENLVRLYLGCEVECIGARRNLHRWKEQCRRKRKELQNISGRYLRRLDPLWRFFILGDYCRRLGTPTTTIKDIRRRCCVVDRVQDIVSENKHAHPIAAFDFCIQYPTATAQDFAELKEKTQSVFRLEGERIMRYFTPAERAMLKDTPLKDCVEEFENKDKKRLVCTQLHNWGIASALAKKIVSHEACQLRIRREDDEGEIARKLLKFWEERQNVESRRTQLHAVFNEKGLTPQGSSSPQKRYIYGLIDCDPEEIVGIEAISSRRHFSLIAKDRFERVSIAVARFEQCLCSQKLSYQDSISEAISFARSVPLATVRDVRNSWDYKQLTTGYWSDQWYVL